MILAARVLDQFARDGRDLVIGQVDLTQDRQSIEVVLKFGYIVIGHLEDLQIG